PGHEAPHLRYRPAPGDSLHGVAGRTLHPVSGTAHLVHGPSGVTVVNHATLATVRYAECRALSAWPDGTRRLIGRDGIVVHVDPAHWRDPGALIAEIDAAVPADRVIRLPAKTVAPQNQPPAEPLDLTIPAAPARDRWLERLPFLPAPICDDPGLRTVLSRVRGGDLEAGRALLAAVRDDHELRVFRLDRLKDAVDPPTLSALADARPDDPELQLWAGAAQVAGAWRIRSAARAEQVAHDRFRRFWIVLSQAGERLYRAADLLPGDPSPWNQLQSYGLGMQLPRPELDRIWDELTRRDPGLFQGHQRRVQVLAAKWQGSDAENRAFAEEAARSAKPGDPIAAIVAAAHLESAAESGGRTAYLAQPDVHASLVTAAERFLAGDQSHLRRREAHQLFGAAFYTAGDQDRARTHLAKAGRTRGDSLAWGYVLRPTRAYLRVCKELGLGRNRSGQE
ncbi:hypothetical protein, partial [Actinocorallia lasiicapitis]